MSEDRSILYVSDFYLTRRGMRYVRWRATMACVRSQDPSPYHDPVMASILRKVDNSTAVALVEAFDFAYEKAARDAREMSFDRAPDLGPKPISPRGWSSLPYREPAHRNDAFERNLLRRFRWFGQMAYAKGIDRSPTHDRVANKEMKRFANETVLILLRAWEEGWDDAYEYVAELALERQSVLDAPKVLSARTIRQPNDKKSMNKE